MTLGHRMMTALEDWAPRSADPQARLDEFLGELRYPRGGTVADIMGNHMPAQVALALAKGRPPPTRPQAQRQCSTAANGS